MSVVADRAPSPSAAPAPRRDAEACRWARVVVGSDLAALEADWRALEADALVTPYQAYDWVHPFATTIGRAEGMDFRFVRVEDGQGDLLALFPLVVTRRLGTRFAEFIGGKHANYHMALYRPDFAEALDAAAAQQLLQEIGAAIGGIDALFLINQPTAWQGISNPPARLAAGQSPSRAYKLALEPGDCEGTLRRSMSKHARKKMTTKRNRFAEFGPSELVQARSDAEIERVLDAFLAQKAARFAQMGVPDPFAAPAIRTFLREGAIGRPSHSPAIELYSLDLAGRSVATYVGAVQGKRFSGMATSFDLFSETSRTSPGEILLVELIKRKCQVGLTMFDLGVGEARYKTTICDDSDELVDTFVPLTAKGRAYASYSQAKRALKRRIKASPLALKMAQRILGLLRRRKPAEADE
ncbi:GNAT family N-acetyltransferase [Bosea sp. (in: a-proteobacteria)]|jgi:CelD/BcsL family acetyltransferase involved in cellulose biosynthesis|uniref:GNAT family N-acetyltransferase n=1 Tax=Bosea sp. (in: a-proteobacteria) TaxID=1871050 RepID=UPI002DDD7A56|nr:GNAT family N-acetyltransferase [Bosea sp. (in: a-proteobacteria)]HEV2513093.1 GNAT family N-acetyltransferase [Bosea sp. (in: a-proteobacteria)]